MLELTSVCKKRGEELSLWSKGIIDQSTIKHYDFLDDYTITHSQSVGRICREFSDYLNLSKYESRVLINSALLHDIGKVCSPKDILTSKKKLTDREYEIIQRHPIYGCDILKRCYSLEDEGKIVLHHHEKWDGTGYPYRLRGHKIPKLSRILNIVDAYDAMTSERCYSKKLELNEAITELVNNKYTQFDGELVDLFIQFITL